MKDNRISEQNRLRFFSDAFVLSTLCKSSALEKLSDILEANQTHGTRWATHVLRGYKLVAETALYGLLERIIGHPDFLNMEEDSSLSRWWAFFQGDDGTSLNAAMSDKTSQLGQIVVRIDHILTILRQSVKPWERFRDAIREAGVFADLLSEVGLSCTVAPFDGNGGTPDTKSLLKLSAVERLHDYHKSRELHSTYHYVHRERPRRNDRSQGGIGIEYFGEAETSRDHIPRSSGMTQLPEDLGIGVLVAVMISLRDFGFPTESRGNGNDVFPQGFNGSGALTSVVEDLECAGALQYPSMSFGLKPPQEIPTLATRKLGGPRVPPTPEERLRVLLSGSTQLVGSKDYFDVRRFEVLVEGIASVLPEDSPIEVLRVVHTDDSDSTKSVSLGVSMPVPQLALSDYSTWWMFYRVYDLGGFGSANRLAYQVIEDLLRKFEGRIRVEEIPEVRTEYLVELIDKSALREENRRLREEIHRLKVRNSDLRGAVPEMLAGLLLARIGYQFVRTSHKVRFPEVGERELDAIGVRSSDAGNECLIVEAKGQHDSQYNLMKQVRRLEEKIQLARSNGHLVARTLGYDEPIARFTGRFIAMADLSIVLDNRGEDAEEDSFAPLSLVGEAGEVREFLDGLVDIELWDYGRFKGELRQAGMSENYIKLLERFIMTWHVGSSKGLPPLEG